MESRAEALSFLKDNTTGVLATISSDLLPRARLVYYTSDDSFCIYFATLANTRKAEDMRAHPMAAFTISNAEVPRTLQIEGTITNITESITLDPKLGDLTEVLFSNAPYFAPLNRFDAGMLEIYKLKPTWIRWGNFTSETGSDKVFTPLT